MYILWQSPEAIVIQSRHSDVALRIDRTSGSYTPTSAEKINVDRQTGSIPIGAFLGSIQLRGSKYLVISKTGKPAGEINGKPVWKLEGFELVALRDNAVRDDVDREYISLLHDHLDSAPIFFATEYDLTTCMQRAKSFNYVWEVADNRFFWNFEIARDGIEAARQHRELGEFVHVVIFGVFSMQTTSFLGTPVEFGLITRRSRFRAGTRYFRRGIDAEGNVANFNESEQVLTVNDKTFSYVQVRGSVPAFWGEVNNMKYRPTLRIGGVALDAARKHFHELESVYGPTYLVNLVNQSGYEKPVKDLYENIVAALKDKELHYIYFDFHHECSKMRWYRVHLLIEQLIAMGLNGEKWFECDNIDGKVLGKQTSVVRTNCMDCLDRTNVVQSTLGSWVLQQQLEVAGLIDVDTKWEVDSGFVRVFRDTWADNADGVSVAYSGTGALKTDFTRTGKRTKLGALRDLQNSIKRYYLNNLSDGPRQDGYNLFLGDCSVYDSVSPFIDRRPIWIQSVPYVFVGSAFVFLLSILYPSPDHSTLFDTSVSLAFFLLGLGSFMFIVRRGLQYVNWPKLVPLDYIGWKKSKGGWTLYDKGSKPLQSKIE